MGLYGNRNVSSSLGFAMGWLYFYSLGILVPYEITAAGLVIDYWESPVNIAVWITIFIVVIIGLNTLPVQFYGETEFWFASLKVFMMIALIREYSPQNFILGKFKLSLSASPKSIRPSLKAKH